MTVELIQLITGQITVVVEWHIIINSEIYIHERNKCGRKGVKLLQKRETLKDKCL